MARRWICILRWNDEITVMLVHVVVGVLVYISPMGMEGYV